jgi:alpha-D-xyloside xylohydrolase
MNGLECSMKIIGGMTAASVAALALCFGSSDATAATGLDAKGHLQAVSPRVDAAFAYARLTNGVQVRVGDITKNVIFYGPQTVRVNANLGENYWTAPSLVVIGTPQLIPFTLSETDHAVTIQSAKLRIEIGKTTGALRFVDAAGKLYTEEKADAPQTLKKVTISGAPTLEARNVFTLRPDEAIYGFGFNGEDKSNRRGRELLLVQTNVGIIIPVMMSSRRYGVMWDNYSQMRFKDDAEGASLWAESAPGGVDYRLLFHGRRHARRGGRRLSRADRPSLDVSQAGVRPVHE